MKIKKVLAAAAALLIGISISNPVKANRWEELKKAIAAAELRLSHAKASLYLANRTAYKILVEQLWTERYQRAEKFLRENHPNEYWEYIAAKAELDELRELCFNATMNDLKDNEE